MLSYVKNKKHDVQVVEASSNERLKPVDKHSVHKELLEVLRCMYLELLKEIPVESFNREGFIEARLMQQIHSVCSTLKYEMKDYYKITED